MTPDFTGSISRPTKALTSRDVMAAMQPWAIAKGLIPAPRRDEDYPEDSDEEPYDPDAP